ncbi:MAG TPA: Asp-tRNA(Asn)/Glu-tRNA(Gln) amidotransferase subunit GatC [Saprospiraceae bacterium]|nr:Asp-tRNA(Asn)/Glu-tRNA(Gln) amidotransferase subunit GatC [Saprospiraceae bacterium]HMP25796.1 Asp-tRNA(Asn)/Glu-tRNA(Gln) amidotransferase subunit GatC [Saprospiraceae bacterium]
MIDENLISRLEELARLELSPEEKKALLHELQNILALVEKMEELDTTGVEPLIYINENLSALREDVIAHQVSREDALRNAPDSDGTFFKVPKVIDLK